MANSNQDEGRMSQSEGKAWADEFGDRFMEFSRKALAKLAGRRCLWWNRRAFEDGYEIGVRAALKVVDELHQHINRTKDTTHD